MGFGTLLASLGAIVVALALVAALAFGFIYLLKLWQDRSLAAAGTSGRGGGIGMRFVRALPLGQSERLVLVEVGDELLLLGVAGHGVTLLKHWPLEDVHGEASVEPVPAAGAALAARFRAVPGLRGKS